MNEQQWLTATEPFPMWEHLRQTGLPSDRKLKLWVEAGRSRIGPQRWANLMETSAQIQTAAYDTAYANCYTDECPKALRAALFREVLGNIFRPVTLPKTRRVEVDVWDGGPAGYRMECPWLTPQVLSLAQAAYEERPGRKCEKCGGAKGYWPGNVRLGDLADENWQRCEACGGTGRVSDGSLDPLTLLALADALEEAGCQGDRPSGRVVVYGFIGGHKFHVLLRRGGASEDEELHAARSLRAARKWAEAHCAIKDWHRFRPVETSALDRLRPFPYLSGDGVRPSEPHPVVAHLREPGPHYRGCHALDVVLGKS